MTRQGLPAVSSRARSRICTSSSSLAQYSSPAYIFSFWVMEKRNSCLPMASYFRMGRIRMLRYFMTYTSPSSMP
ncbi:hypothetical protein BH24BAC1_BH24BAC1_08040 [soil metagenome]